MFKSSQPKEKLLAPPGRYRDLAPRSIIDRRDAVNALLCYSHKVELRAAVYAYGENSYLVSATTGITESGPVVKLPYDVTSNHLGNAILDSLLECYAHPSAPPNDPLSAWAAFAASGAKTGKSFESKSTYITVHTAGMAIISEASRRRPPSEMYVGQSISITCDPPDLGDIVKRLVRTLRLLESQDAL